MICNKSGHQLVSSRHHARKLAASMILATMSCIALSACAPAALKPSERGLQTGTVQRPVLPGAVPDTGDDNGEKTSEDNSAARNAPQNRSAYQPAVLALRKQADAALQENDLPTASRLLERALRIDPRDSATYLALARLRQQQNQPEAALQLIEKGLSLHPEPALKEKLRTLRGQITARSA